MTYVCIIYNLCMLVKTVISAYTENMFLLFDIGATKTRLAVSDGNSDFKKVLIIETEKDYSKALELFKYYLSTLPSNIKITAGAGDIPGVLDKRKSMLISPPDQTSLPDWFEKPLKEDLQNIIEGPVFLDNDACLVGLGEAVFGAGKGFEIVAYLTISSGVGGARIVKGQIDKKSYGFEPGFQIIDKDKSFINYQSGTLTGLIDGTNLEKRYGKKAEEINDPEVWDEVAKNLAVGLNNTIVHWSPDVVVLGGSVTKSIPFDKLNSYLKQTVQVFSTLPEIKLAELDDIGGLWGTLAFLKNKSV